MASPQGNDTDTLQKVLKWFDQDLKAQQDLLSKYKKGYDAYNGILDYRSQAADWTHKLTPRYALQVIEHMKAALLDPNPQARLRPRPRMASPQEIEFYRNGVQANEILLNEQWREDRFLEKQGPFALQALICGLTVGKCYWDYKDGPRTRQQVIDHEPVYGPFGEVTATRPVVGDVTQHEIDYARPTFEVVDARDFIWHEAAISLDRAMRVHHRCYYTLDELKELEKQGMYRNVDDLSESRPEKAAELESSDLYAPKKAKDMVSLVETWYRTAEGLRVATVGNRKVLLADRESPFQHGDYPFVVCSTQPGLFKIPGTSEIELMAEQQIALWSFLNQSLDNVALMNNGVLMVGLEVEDIDDLQFFPGAVNQVARPDAVQWFRPDAAVTQLAQPWMSAMRDDLRDIPGASLSLLGQTDPSTQTATEISAVTTLAMRRVQAKKAQVNHAHKRKGEQDIELNQQFIREDQVVAIVGPGDEYDFRTVSPLEIQGRYGIILDPMDESLMKQERTAQATSRFQIMLQAAPVFAAMHQGDPEGTPMLNIKSGFDDVLRAGGVDDTTRYYLESPAAEQVAAQGQGQQGPPSPNGNGGPPSGVTAPQAADLNSPSNPLSQSPLAAMQRFLAQRGGPSNA